MLDSPEFTRFIFLPEPAQQRSRDALNRLLDAGEQLLAQNAFEEASVAQIAELAKSSVGTFYRILGDKDTLSKLLLQRFFLSAVSTINVLTDAEQWTTQPLQRFIQALTEQVAALYQGRRGVLRALILRASRDADFRDRVHQLNEHIAASVVRVLQAHKQEVHHPSPLKAMQAAVHILLGALNQHTVTGNLGHLSQAELVQELSRILVLYLDIHS
jgi:AcrR family transcriptional regulator